MKKIIAIITVAFMSCYAGALAQDVIVLHMKDGTTRRYVNGVKERTDINFYKHAPTTTYTPDDASLTSSSYFGGIYDEKTKEYRFRITNYVQQKLKQESSDVGLNIVVSGAGVRGNRLVFRGTDELYSDRARLEIYYTEY